MTDQLHDAPIDGSSPPARCPRSSRGERPGGPTEDELLDEALKETFPASDAISVYRVENFRTALDSSNDYVEKNGLRLGRYRRF